MDSSQRCVNIQKEDERLAEQWILRAADIQQKYYEKYSNIPWQYVKGKREILEMEVKEAIFEDGFSCIRSGSSASSKEKKVNMLVDVIYKQVYIFSEYQVKFLKPFNKYQNGNIKFPVFFITAPKNAFVIDQEGSLYSDKFQFMKAHKFKPFVYCYYAKTLKVHDFQTLLNEVKCGLQQKPFVQGETNDTDSPCEEDMIKVTMLCNKIYERLCLIDDFAVAHLRIIGKKNDNFIHFPVIRVACKNNQNSAMPSLFYMDHIGRIYKNWNDFLNHNIYPKSLLCYPREGTYGANQSGKVLLDIAYSPACGKTNIPILTATGTVIGLGPLIFGVGILGTVAIGTSVLFGIASGIGQLHDCWSHKQSLKSCDAMNGWFSLTSAAAGAGSGALALATRASQLTKEAEVAMSVLKYFTHSMKVAEKISSFYNENRKIIRSLRGVKITMEEVDEIFSYIKVPFIKLKKIIIKFSKKVKMFLVEQWYIHFCRQDNSVIAGNISSTISLSEKLESHMKECETEDEYLDIVEFINIYKANILKNMEKMYLQEKHVLQETLGEKFDESILNKRWCLDGVNDRKTAFMKYTSEVSVEDFKSLYDEYSKKVPTLNESDNLKFPSNGIAINHCFKYCVRDSSTLAPEEYFDIIRKIAKNDRVLVKSEDCDHGKCVTYRDNSYPMTVKVLIIGEEKFFVSTDFED